MIRNSTAKSVLTYRSGNEHALVVSRNLELQTPARGWRGSRALDCRRRALRGGVRRTDTLGVSHPNISHWDDVEEHDHEEGSIHSAWRYLGEAAARSASA
jgi:hypothetical protein